jgi:hypothetical protein
MLLHDATRYKIYAVAAACWGFNPNSQVIASLLKEKKHGDKGEVR